MSFLFSLAELAPASRRGGCTRPDLASREHVMGLVLLETRRVDGHANQRSGERPIGEPGCET